MRGSIRTEQTDKFTEMYENNVYTLHKKFPGWPLLQHEGQVYILLTSAHVDVATVLGVGSVVKGEAWPEETAQHHQSISPFHLDAPGPWEKGKAEHWSQSYVHMQRPQLLELPGPGAKVLLGEGKMI